MSYLCLAAYPLSAAALLLIGCATASTVQIPQPRPNEGYNRSYPVGYSELFMVAQNVLKELDYKVTEMNQESGVIHGNVGEDQDRAAQFESMGKKYSRLFGTRVAFRVDITQIGHEETKIQIVARGEGGAVLKDPDQVERDFLDNVRLHVGKLAEKKTTVSTDLKKPTDAVSQGAELPAADVDYIRSFKGKTKQNAYAVIVGVENYRDLPKVDFATRDAETVKQYLIKVLGYPEEHIILRTNERATKADFEAYFENWLKNNVDKNADVFVYYAGHGAPDPTSGKSFLVPYDGNPSFLETTAYPLNRLYKSLSELPTSHIIVALDSCFSGAGGRSVIAKGTRPMMIRVENPAMAVKNITVLSAATGNQISSAYPEKSHGLFTYFFLKGLMGEADINEDGEIELHEVFAYLKPQVERQARRSNQEQTPQYFSSEEALGNKNKQVLFKLK